MESATTSVVAGRVYEEVVFRVSLHRLDFRLPLGERVGNGFDSGPRPHPAGSPGGDSDSFHSAEEDQAEDGVFVGDGPELLVELAEEGLGRGVGHGREKKLIGCNAGILKC